MFLKSKFQFVDLIKILVVLALFWKIGQAEFAYDHILDWLITGTAIYTALMAYQSNSNTWASMMAIIAILYNPIEPITLDESTWLVLDLISAGIFFVAIFAPENDKSLPPPNKKP